MVDQSYSVPVRCRVMYSVRRKDIGLSSVYSGVAVCAKIGTGGYLMT